MLLICCRLLPLLQLRVLCALNLLLLLYFCAIRVLLTLECLRSRAQLHPGAQDRAQQVSVSEAQDGRQAGALEQCPARVRPPPTLEEGFPEAIRAVARETAQQ